MCWLRHKRLTWVGELQPTYGEPQIGSIAGSVLLYDGCGPRPRFPEVAVGAAGGAAPCRRGDGCGRQNAKRGGRSG